MLEVGSYEAKTHLPALLSRAQNGEEIIITKRGIPIARLVPYEKQRSKADIKQALEKMQALRAQIAADWKKRGLKPLTAKEIREMIHEGHRY